MSSATNALPLLASALALNSREVGVVALAQGIAIVGLALCRGVATTPMQLELREREPWLLLRSAAGLAAICGVLFGAILGAGWALWGPSPVAPVVIVAVGLGPVALHECLRGYCYSTRQVALALGSQVTWGLVELVVLLVPGSAGLSPVRLLTAWAAGGLGAVAVLSVLLGVAPSFSSIARHARSDGRRRVVLATDYVLGQAGTNLVPVFGAIGAGLSASGTVVATRIWFSPVSVVLSSLAVSGLTPIAVAARQSSRDGHREMRRFSRRGLLVIALNSVLVAVGCLVGVLLGIRPETFAFAPLLLAPIDLAFLAIYGPGNQLLASLGRLRGILAARVAWTVIGTIGVVVGGRLGGALGISLALVLTSAVPVAIVTRTLQTSQPS